MLLRCSQPLDQALLLLQQRTAGSVLYELYRSACVEEIEIIIELAGKLLKKVLRPRYASHRQAETPVYKDIFRAAAQHSNLPIFMNTHDWATLPASFHPRILARYEVLRSGAAAPAVPV